MFPEARREGIIVRELADETLVFDKKRNKAHCLNPSAAFVWKHCNGSASVKQIAESMREEMDLPADEEVVLLALDRLRRAKLLEEAPALKDMRRVSRRELLKRVGIAAAIAPVVLSITASPASAQVSGLSAQACAARPAVSCGGTPCIGGVATCQPSGLNCAYQ